MAVATPTILPVPIVERAVHKAAKLDTSLACLSRA